MKTTVFALTLFLSTNIALAEDPTPRERTGQYYDGYERYYNRTDRMVRTTVNDEDVLATGTTANGVAAYVRNPYTGTVIRPNNPPGSGVVVMSDAHLDAKKFIQWVEAGRPANHPFVKSYEGSTFRKFMDGIPASIRERRAAGANLSSMDIVWGGDPFDRGAFEALSVEDRKKAFRYFAQELKAMPPVDGVQYNFIASLGDHEVTKVNASWDNSTAWKAAKVNGQNTAAERIKGLREAALDDFADRDFARALDNGPLSVDRIEVDKVKSLDDLPASVRSQLSSTTLSNGQSLDEALEAFMKNADGFVDANNPIHRELLEKVKGLGVDELVGKTYTVADPTDWTKGAQKARKGLLSQMRKAAAANPDTMAKARRLARMRYRAYPRAQIDIPKVKLGTVAELDALPQSVLEKLRGERLADGTSLYDALKKEIGLGGVLDANNSPLHREILEKYGKVHGKMEGALFADISNSAKVQSLDDAKLMSGFMETKSRPIGLDEGDFLKRNGVKPPARARQLNGIDDQLKISNYSDEFGEVFRKEGFRVDRSTFSPYEATVNTGQNGRQYAHRHVQYGNLDRAILEKPQMDAIVARNTTGAAEGRIRLPDVRVELVDDQADAIKRLTNAAPEELLGKANITDDVFKGLEDVIRTGKLPNGAAASTADLEKARELLSTGDRGLLRGQHAVQMNSSTVAGMNNNNIVVPGRTDVLENAGQQSYGQHLQADNGRIVQNHSKTTMGRSSADDVRRVSSMDGGAILFTSDTHNPSMNFAAAMDPEMAAYMDEICPGCVGTRPEVNSGSMSASAKNPGRPNTVAIDFGDGKATHLQMDPKTGAISNFDAIPEKQREWLRKLKEAQQAGDDAFVKFLMDPETGRDPITKRSMLGDDPVDALRNILPCK